MAMSASQRKSLKKLIDRADALALSAGLEWGATILEIRKEVAFLSAQLDLGGSAKAREQVINGVQKHINRLNRRLDRVFEAEMNHAMHVAHANALENVGVAAKVVRYDPKRSAEILKWVESTNGGNMAAVFTDGMSKHAISVLRNAVVGAFQENAVAGGSLRELGMSIRDRWETAVGKKDTFAFVDRAGRKWDTAHYLATNVRTNMMNCYNNQVVDTYSRATGSDYVEITDDGRTAKISCEKCRKWAGRILCVSGKDPDFPTIQDAQRDGMFHPNCIHTLDPVNEKFQKEKIEAERERWKRRGW